MNSYKATYRALEYRKIKVTVLPDKVYTEDWKLLNLEQSLVEVLRVKVQQIWPHIITIFQSIRENE